MSETVTLRNGLTVLARRLGGPAGKLYAIQYVNRTQATKAAEKHRGRVWNRGGPVFYVVLNGLPLEERGE